MFATDVESTRYALGGVLVELDARVDHDGRHRRPPPGPDVGPGRGRERRRRRRPGSPVIPVKALKLIERNLDDDDPPVHLAIQAGTAVLVRTERAVIYSRLVEGRFPRYQDVFPANVEVKIPMEAGPLAPGRRAGVDRHQRGEPRRRLPFGDGLLKLSSQAADVGSSHVDLPIAYEGKPVEITFDPRYLIDALKTLDDAPRHRRADRPQERRRLQDRRPLYLRGHAPDPRPLTRDCALGRPGSRTASDRPVKRSKVRCFVSDALAWPVANARDRRL